MSKRFKIVSILSIITIAIFSMAIFTFGVSAKSESELSASITNKVKYANLFRCYDNIHNSVETLNFNSASDLFTGSDSALVGPEGWSGVSGRCSDLVNGMIGSVPSAQSSRGQVLQKLGYSGGGTSSRCVWFEYTKFARTGSGGYSENKIATDKVCASVAADGTMSNYQRENAAGEPYNVVSFDGSQLVANYEDKIGGGVYEMYVQGYNNNWDSFVSAYASKVKSMNGQSSFVGANGTTDTYYGFSSCNGQSGACTEDASAGSGSYSISNRSTAASIAASNYLKLSNGNFTTAEKVSLYQFYLKNNSSSIVCNPTDTPDSTVARKVKLVIDSKYYENCYAIERNPGATSVHAVDGSFSLTGTINYDGIISALNSMTATTDREGIINPGAAVGAETGTPTTPDPTDPTNSTDPTESGNGGNNPSSTDDVCYGSEGTLGLSWIVCPIAQMMYDALDTIYETAEENFLELQPELLGEKTHNGWSIFQNAANIIFIILVIVVIFSQLTGVGIDNYGIKKILPRLIICAILVNLSFFITQLLFDASNIIGVSIRSLFESLSAGGDQAAGGAVAGEAVGGGLILGAAGITIAAFVTNPALLLSLLLALITGVFAVLTLLAILVAREVGVVIAVIIAPLAFVSYMFPNTSKWLKSWGNLVKGLLLLYPLAAGVVGASAFVGGIIGNIDKSNNFLNLAAMLVRVVPFFFLPTLFRRSISAMGNLGATIQGFGRGLSRGATGAMRNAEWYRNAQERGMEHRTRIRAGINQDGTEATGWRGLLRSRNDRNRARYRQQYLKNQAEQEKADLLNSPEYLEAMREKQALDRRAEQNEVDLMNSPDYRRAIQAKQDTDLEKKQTEAQASALLTGGFRRTDGRAVNSSSIDSLRDALISEASRDDEQDIGKIRALYDALVAKGDDGIDALAKVWDSGTLKGEGLQRITESIASDGNIKAKARSLHATANDVMNPSSGVTYTAGQVEAARTAGTYASKIKPEMLSGMTDGERDSYIQYANNTGDSTAMRNIYLASQNINSFKPGEQRAVYDVADRYIQDHTELAKAGTYTNDYGEAEELRRDADGRLIRASDGSEITSDWFKQGNYRLKRN